MQKIGFAEAVDRILAEDPRYHRDVYAFIRDALDFTVKQQKKNKEGFTRHVTPGQLLDGIRVFALKEFGPMVPTVFGYWNVRSCEDLGYIVFNMIRKEILGKNESDTHRAVPRRLRFPRGVRRPVHCPAAPDAPAKPESGSLPRRDRFLIAGSRASSSYRPCSSRVRRPRLRITARRSRMICRAEHGPGEKSGLEIPVPPVNARVRTLPNGLTIIIEEDHSAPVASLQAWCQTGSIHEGRHIGAGLSHILEHMLFKGTEKRSTSEFVLKIQDQGGYINAYTSYDRTVFWIDIPIKGVATALDLLSDAMMNSTLPPLEYRKEQEVIRREFAMGYDDPDRMAAYQLMAAAYQVHPYRIPVIGHLDVLQPAQARRRDGVLQAPVRPE